LHQAQRTVGAYRAMADAKHPLGCFHHGLERSRKLGPAFEETKRLTERRGGNTAARDKKN
jgi:hypothetical protein